MIKIEKVNVKGSFSQGTIMLGNKINEIIDALNPPEEKECKKLCNHVVHSIELHKEQFPECFSDFKSPKPEDWAIGLLTFDELRNIIEVCNVKYVKVKTDSLTISFVPKNATGSIWELVKEKTPRTIKE